MWDNVTIKKGGFCTLTKRSAKKYPSLRFFITVTIMIIVAFVLLLSVGFYYIKTSSILRKTSRDSIVRELNQVNDIIQDQVETIDSVIPLFMSNEIIQDALENPGTGINYPFSVERQMSYIYNSSALSEKNFTDSIYIYGNDNAVYHTYTSGILENITNTSEFLQNTVDPSDPHLMCYASSLHDQNMYFARNLYSSNSGNRIGMIVININARKWIKYCAKMIDPSWFIMLFDDDFSLSSDLGTSGKKLQALYPKLTSASNSILFKELRFNDRDYFMASQPLGQLGLTSAVAAPRDVLLQNLNSTLKSYLLVTLAIAFIALIAAFIISRAVTRPVDAMIAYINEISQGNRSTLPPEGFYQEFHVWAQSFNQMLQQLDTYYKDIYQQKLLIKNAEIRALQSQMDPHFLFNVLNTIAWKAQMIDNEEIYEMVISLGSMLKMNTLSRNHTFTSISKEMEYVRLYVYLQQMRFEDKISCDIQIPEQVLSCQIPCLSIQPLAENAIVHGLEPKKGKGHLIIQIIESDNDMLEICIIDNGIGFETIPDIQQIAHSDKDSHTHIGLKNLDKRLELLYGPDAHIKITSIPDKCTTVSFHIPRKEASHDL
ncbi:sensor histidine kinase [Blautia sp. MSJ-19]|nr:sensor histidine kinase [Blautia sp. MSJ-19]